jgi:hypothetical protein
MKLPIFIVIFLSVYYVSKVGGDICIETFDPDFVTSLPNCTSSACSLVAVDFENSTGVWNPVSVHQYEQTANLTLRYKNITGCFGLVPSGFYPFQLNAADEIEDIPEFTSPGFDICYDSEGEHVEFCTQECIEKPTTTIKCIESSHYKFTPPCTSQGPSWCEHYLELNKTCYGYEPDINFFYWGAPNQTFANGVCLCTHVTETRIEIEKTTKFVRSCGALGQFARQDDSDDTSEIHIKVDDDIMSIENDAAFDIECRATKDDWIDTIAVDKSGLKKYTLPERLFMRGGYLFVTCFGNHSKVESTRIYLPGKVICRISDCLLCKEAFTGFNCLPIGHKIALITLLIFAALLLAASCPCIYWLLTGGAKTVFYTLKYLFCCVFKWQRTRMGKWIKNKATGAYERVSEGFEEAEEEMATTPEPEEGVRRKNKRQALFGVFIALMIMSSQLKPAFACESVVVLGGSTEECENGPEGAQNCTFVVNNDFIFNYLGETVCFKLIDKGTDKEVGSGSIKLEKVPVFWTAVKDYWTSRWVGKYKSFKHCGNVDWCDSDTCIDFLPNATADLESEGFTHIKWPGRSDCRATCGCAGCGCFYCSDACVESRAFLEPSGIAIQVSHIQSPIASVILSVNLKHAGHEDNFKYQMRVGEDQEIEGIKFTLSALDIPEISTPKDKHLACLKGDQGCMFVQASEKNIPSRAVIGDIQADTDVKLNQMGVNAFIFASEIFLRADAASATSYTFAKSGYDTSWEASRKNGEVPGTVDGRFWNYESNTLTVEVENDISAQVVMSMSDGFRIQLLRSKVCPEVTIKDVSGCYQCSLGFSVRITGHSSCESGLVTVTSDDTAVQIYTTSFLFNETETEYLILGSTERQQNNFNLVFSGTQSARSNIVFTGSVEKTINDQIYVKGQGEIKGNDGGGSETDSPFGEVVDNSFKKAADVSDWLHIIIWIAVAVAGLVVIVIIGAVLWKIDLRRFIPRSIKAKMT